MPTLPEELIERRGVPVAVVVVAPVYITMVVAAFSNPVPPPIRTSLFEASELPINTAYGVEALV